MLVFKSVIFFRGNIFVTSTKITKTKGFPTCTINTRTNYDKGYRFNYKFKHGTFFFIKGTCLM